jgi:hypothetical protein
MMIITGRRLVHLGNIADIALSGNQSAVHHCSNVCLPQQIFNPRECGAFMLTVNCSFNANS